MKQSIGHILLSILFFAGLTSGSYHNSGEAFFTFWESDKTLVLTVRVETHDLEEVLNFGKNQSKELAGAKYVQKHFKCKINNKPIPINFEEANTKNGWTDMLFTLEHPVHNIERMNINTDCFISLSKDHVNLLAFSIKGVDQSYTLGQKRKSITIKF